MTVRWRWVALFGGSAGLGMGVLTSLVGLEPGIEPWIWMAQYVVWGLLSLGLGMPAFRTLFASSFLSGLLTGPVQAALIVSYTSNNPWYASLFLDGTATRATMMAQSIVMGFVFGVLMGCVFAAVQAVSSRVRRRASV